MAPILPPLFFQDKTSSSDALSMLLPSEVLCGVTGFLDWGDFAKLACVQESWKSLVADAASQGGREATWELAQALLEGEQGLQRHPERAIQLLEQLAAATQPFAPAMKKLADCHLQGHGVQQNAQQGIHWLTRAFDRGGDVDAAHELALLHEYGDHSVEIDVFVAADWFYKAAQAGHVEAMAEYAMCCELGCGRAQSDEEALEWYIKAANKGHVTSNYSVGEAFEEARGVPQSDEEACLWYYKAAIEGDEDSKKALRRLHSIARIVLPGVAGVLDA